MNNNSLTTLLFFTLFFGIAPHSQADDLDIYKPKNKESVTAENINVWFRYDDQADGYLIDLVGNNTKANKCNGVINFTGFITREGASCLNTAGGENKGNNIIGGDNGTAFPKNQRTRVCSWTVPNELTPGFYALSITAYNAKTGSLADNGTTQDALTRNGDCKLGYQDFNVIATTIPPEPVAALLPDHGISCDNNDGVDPVAPALVTCVPRIQGTNSIMSVDTSASWIQLWVNDKDGFNLTQRWYKVGNGTNKVRCSVSNSQNTCTLPDIAGILELGVAPYTWWVRAWNPVGTSSWSSAATMSN